MAYICIKCSVLAGVVHQRISSEQLELLVNALCSDTVRGADQGPAQLQLLAVVSNTISLAGSKHASLGLMLCMFSTSYLLP